jgi:hypothetical protein
MGSRIAGRLLDAGNELYGTKPDQLEGATVDRARTSMV